MLSDLASYERSVYSQGGEDGTLERVFDVIGRTNRQFVEFGAKDGVALSNTAYLRLEHGWSGLLMDAAAAGDGLVRRERITAENVEVCFGKYGVPREPDLLSIDIDGNDYWVWRAIERYRPRVVVIEYNQFFELDEPRVIPYDPEFVWDRTAYHGASLAAMHKLGRRKGYTLVHTDSYAPNAIFVRRDELGAEYQPRPLAELTIWQGFGAPPDPLGRPWETV